MMKYEKIPFEKNKFLEQDLDLENNFLKEIYTYENSKIQFLQRECGWLFLLEPSGKLVVHELTDIHAIPSNDNWHTPMADLRLAD